MAASPLVTKIVRLLRSFSCLSPLLEKRPQIHANEFLNTREKQPVRSCSGPRLGDLEHLDARLLLPYLHEKESSGHGLNETPLPDGLRLHTSEMAEIGTPLTATSHWVGN